MNLGLIWAIVNYFWMAFTAWFQPHNYAISNKMRKTIRSEEQNYITIQKHTNVAYFKVLFPQFSGENEEAKICQSSLF